MRRKQTGVLWKLQYVTAVFRTWKVVFLIETPKISCSKSTREKAVLTSYL